MKLFPRRIFSAAIREVERVRKNCRGKQGKDLQNQKPPKRCSSPQLQEQGPEWEESTPPAQDGQRASRSSARAAAVTWKAAAAYRALQAETLQSPQRCPGRSAK